jgi:hypothetical protein
VDFLCSSERYTISHFLPVVIVNTRESDVQYFIDHGDGEYFVVTNTGEVNYEHGTFLSHKEGARRLGTY